MIVSLCNYTSFGQTEFTMCFGEQLTIISQYKTFSNSSSSRDPPLMLFHWMCLLYCRWLFTGISRNKAIELLMEPQNLSGAFLIRESETTTDGYSLSVLRRTNSSDCVKHYRISNLQNGWFYISPRLTFPSLQHLVEHYSDGLCCRLSGPCFIKGFDNAREARPVPTAIRRPTFNWKDISRSMIFRRKRTESDNSLVSEGLREAISSYLQMTECLWPFDSCCFLW
uniref:Src like adaptor 2a n=1 Tax=Labrus bergylta TaxID=56723 RepID=A0A3Q3FRY0_9LABR